MTSHNIGQFWQPPSLCGLLIVTIKYYHQKILDPSPCNRGVIYGRHLRKTRHHKYQTAYCLRHVTMWDLHWCKNHFFLCTGTNNQFSCLEIIKWNYETWLVCISLKLSSLKLKAKKMFSKIWEFPTRIISSQSSKSGGKEVGRLNQKLN